MNGRGTESFDILRNFLSLINLPVGVRFLGFTMHEHGAADSFPLAMKKLNAVPSTSAVFDSTLGDGTLV